MELLIELDETCEFCKETLEALNNEYKEAKPEIYGTRNMDTGEPVQGYVLRPDRNCYGHVTHWHLDRK